MHTWLYRYTVKAALAGVKYLLERRNTFRRPSKRLLRRLLSGVVISVLISTAIQMASDALMPPPGPPSQAAPGRSKTAGPRRVRRTGRHFGAGHRRRSAGACPEHIAGGNPASTHIPIGLRVVERPAMSAPGARPAARVPLSQDASEDPIVHEIVHDQSFDRLRLESVHGQCLLRSDFSLVKPSLPEPKAAVVPSKRVKNRITPMTRIPQPPPATRSKTQGQDRGARIIWMSLHPRLLFLVGAQDSPSLNTDP